MALRKALSWCEHVSLAVGHIHRHGEAVREQLY